MTPKVENERRRIGRPPAGARDGEKVKDYPQLSIRLPGDVKAKLHALARAKRCAVHFKRHIDPGSEVVALSRGEVAFCDDVLAFLQPRSWKNRLLKS